MKPGGRITSLPPNVRWLAFVSFLNDFSSEMIYPLLPQFLTKVLGATAAQLGLIESVAEFTASIVRLGSGWLGDRLPRKKPLVLAGYGLASFVRPFLAAATSPWQVLGIRFLDRLGKGIRGAPRDAILAASVEAERRGLAFGFHRSMDHAGALVGPAAATLLLLAFPGQYRLLFALAALPALASVVVLAVGVREKAPPEIRPGEGDATPSPLHPLTPSPPHPLTPSLPPAFWRYLAVVFLFALANSSDLFLLQRAQDLGVAVALVPSLWVLLHVIKSAGAAPAGHLSDQWSRRALIVAGWLSYAAVYLGFAFAQTPLHVWLLFAGYGLHFALVEGAERALVAELVPPEARSTAYGFFFAAVGLGALPASAVGGWIWTRYGAATMFQVDAALALVAALLLLIALRSEGRTTKHES